jgi:hypothetical protein
MHSDFFDTSQLFERMNRTMISEETLDRYRVNGTTVRVIRDADPDNDVLGIIVAWNDKEFLLRKRNRKVLKLSREYRIQPADEERPSLV